MKPHCESKLDTIQSQDRLNLNMPGDGQERNKHRPEIREKGDGNLEDSCRRASLHFFEEVYGDGGRAFARVSRLCRERTAQLEKMGALPIDPIKNGRDALRAGADLADKHPLEAAALSAGGAAVCAVIAAEAAAPAAIGLATLGTVGFVGGTAWHTGKWAMNEWQIRSNNYWQEFNKNF